MSLVRTLQEESTIVCFMTLLWQVAGDGSGGTWGTGQEYTDGPGRVNPEGLQEALSPSSAPTTGHSTHRPRSTPQPRPTFWVSAHRGLTFQEFPKSTGSSSTWRLLLVRSLFWMPSKFPHRPHTRSWGTSWEHKLCKPQSKLAESGKRGFQAAWEAGSPEEEEDGRGQGGRRRRRPG